MDNKKMKLWKKVLIIILVLFFIFVLLTIRKYIVFTNIINQSKAYTNKTNYIAEVYSLQRDGVSIMKSYNKDGNYLTELQTFGLNIENERKLTIYNKEDERIAIMQSGENKVALLENGVGGLVRVVTFPYIDNIMQKLQLSIMSKITTDNCNNYECYLIEITNRWRVWIEKETGLMRREINGGSVVERSYQFDIVTDENIVKPDISDCEIQQNNK